jgi:hypothetical protein
MKTFGKILLFIVAALVVVHFCPILLVPVVLGGAALLVIGTMLAGGIAAVAATGLSILAGLLAVVLVILALLSPIWLPVLAIVGLVSLCRGGGRKTA